MLTNGILKTIQDYCKIISKKVSYVSISLNMKELYIQSEQEEIKKLKVFSVRYPLLFFSIIVSKTVV